VYEWVEHTGEVELAIEAGSEADVFAEALTALGELLGDEAGGDPERREVLVTASDRGALLVEWLSELVFLADAERFVPERVLDIVIDGQRLQATVEGRRGEPSQLVKAATYHGLSFGLDRGVWKARVVLDV
jgi:SHS2 domain-containing protein